MKIQSCEYPYFVSLSSTHFPLSFIISAGQKRNNIEERWGIKRAHKIHISEFSSVSYDQSDAIFCPCRNCYIHTFWFRCNSSFVSILSKNVRKILGSIMSNSFGRNSIFVWILLWSKLLCFFWQMNCLECAESNLKPI